MSDFRTTTRRRFLCRTVRLAGATLAGGLAPGLRSLTPWLDAAAAPVRGELAAQVPFVNEGRRAVGQVTDSGLAGRLALDLATLTPATLTTPNESFFIRTRRPDRLVDAAFETWTISVGGLVERPSTLRLADLGERTRPFGVHLAECSGNGRARAFGLMSAARWDGVPLTEVLDRLPVKRQATRVLVAGFDEHSTVPGGSRPGASWIFTFAELESTGAFLATRMNGEPLPDDHGFPVRLVVPGWYGCCWSKWVERIDLTGDDAAATAQMREYAGRTHQRGVPWLARDFEPARIEQAAMPVRVGKWRDEDGIFYRVVGILWGGERTIDQLVVRFCQDESFVPVEAYEHETNATWTLWTHTWRPPAPGRYRIELRIDDPGIPARRLDRGLYVREVEIG